MAKTLQAARGEDGEPPFRRYDHAEGPVTALAVDYPPGHVTPAHRHPHAQLLHAVHGVMVVSTQQGQWVVPPTRGMWVPAETEHSTRMVGVVHMRTAFIRPEAAPDLPDACAVLGVSPLLRELIIAALDVTQPYA
ncbi:MAG: AraC family ligand binding domain-containing protein, partial [Solimonas sp.]